MTNNHHKFFLGALIGGALSATLALLITPMSGAQARQQLHKKLNNNALSPLRAGRLKAKKITRRRKVITAKHKAAHKPHNHKGATHR